MVGRRRRRKRRREQLLSVVQQQYPVSNGFCTTKDALYLRWKGCFQSVVDAKLLGSHGTHLQ